MVDACVHRHQPARHCEPNGILPRSTALFIEQVQSARSTEASFWEWLLGMGTIKIDGASGESIQFRNIRAPRQIAEQILAARDHIAATHHLPHTVVDDATIQQMLETLSQPDPVPQATALPGEIASRWPLRRAVHVPLEPGEKVIGVIGRHWWALADRLVRPAGLLMVAGLIGLVGAWQRIDLAPGVAIPAVAALVWGVLAYIDFIDDVFFITTQRIIDVDRRFFVLFESQLAIAYDKIQLITFEEPTLYSRMLGFGTVVIKSASGNAADALRMTTVPAPKEIVAALNPIHSAFKQRAAILASNKKRIEMKDWFADVMSELIATTPDIRGQRLAEGVAIAQHVGLRITVIGEVAVPGVAAGFIVSQNPSPRSRCLRGGDLSVMISRM